MRQMRSLPLVRRFRRRQKKSRIRLKSASDFNRLVAAAKRLLNVVYKNEGIANKDMAKFETQIQIWQTNGTDNRRQTDVKE